MPLIDYRKRRRRRKPKLTLSTETEKVIRSLVITLSIIIAVLGATLIISMSKSSQNGYALQQEKLKNEELMNENGNLATKITQSKTFSELKTVDSVTGMEEIEEKTYVTKEDNEIN